MPRKAENQASPVADFESSLDQLEQLVEKMEHGEMSLEESLAAYERGVGLYRKCQTALEQAELRVRLLSDPEQPGNADTWTGPYVEASASLNDPWGRPILYVLQPGRHGFVVKTLGADGEPGGNGADRDLQVPAK